MLSRSTLVVVSTSAALVGLAAASMPTSGLKLTLKMFPNNIRNWSFELVNDKITVHTSVGIIRKFIHFWWIKYGKMTDCKLFVANIWQHLFLTW